MKPFKMLIPPVKAMIISLAMIGSAFAQTCTWTGGKGDGKWSSAENWENDEKPVSGRGDVVTVSGTGAVGGIIDNDISGLEVAQLVLAGDGYTLSGEKITVTAATQAVKKTGTTSAVTLEVPVEFTSESGEVTLASNDKALNVKGVLSGDVKVVFDGGTFYLYSANTYTGGTQLKSGTLYLHNPACFGQAGTTVTAPGNFTFIEPGDYAYDFVLTATGAIVWCFQPGNTRPTGDFTFSGTVSLPNSTGNWDIQRPTSDGTHKIVFQKPVSAPKAKLQSNAPMAWTVEYHDAVTAAGTYCGYWDNNLAPWFEFYKDAALGSVTPCRQMRIRAKADDVFTTHPPIVFNCSIQPWSGTDDQYNIGLFDMAGHDLTMDRIEHGAAQMTSPSGQIYSSDGAVTLRLEGTADATTVALVKNEVSLVWAPKTTGLVQTFQGRVQKTTGTITVTNGVLRSTGDSSWASVPKIRVEQDGEFRLETSLVNALKGVGKIELAGNGRLTVVSGDTAFGACSLELSADSRLALPEGSYYVFDSVTVDGKELSGGYSGDPASEDYLPQLDGNFSIMVGEKRTAMWTGAVGDGKWSTDGNWKDGLGPNRDCDVVLSNPDDDFEIVNDIDGLRVCSVSFTGAKPFRLSGKALTLATGAMSDSASAVVTNAVDIVLPKGTTTISHTGSTWLHLAGDFSCKAGGATLRLDSTSSSRYVISGSNVLEKIVCVKAGPVLANADLLPAGATLEVNGDFTALRGGDIRYDIVITSTGSPSLKFGDADDRQADFNFHGRISSETVDGTVYFISDYVSTFSRSIHFYGEVCLPKAIYYGRVHENTSIHFHGPVTFAELGGGDWASNTGCATAFYATNTVGKVSPCYSLRLLTMAPDIFPTAPVVSFERAANSGEYATSGQINLCGQNQVFDRLGHFTKLQAVGKESGVIRSYDPVIGSGVLPATVTLRGTASACTTAKVSDDVSVFWCPADAAYVQSFSNRVSTTVGTLAVSNGVLEVSGAASFPNVTRINVMAGGTFRLNTTAANALAGVTNLTVEAGGTFEVVSGVTPFTDKRARIDLQPGAVLRWPADDTYTFSGVMYGTWPLDPGTYTNAKLPELKSGTLVTGRIRGYSGLMLLVR